MNKYIWLIIILAIIIIVLIVVLLYSEIRKESPFEVKTGISVIAPKSGEEISSPVKISGFVNGAGWAGFEGQVGRVDILISGVTIGSAPLKATSEWTTLPTNFEANIPEFSAECPVAPCVFFGPAELVFHNENASGDPAKDKTFTLPVLIKK